MTGLIKQFEGPRQFKLRDKKGFNAVFGQHVIAYNVIQLVNLIKLALQAPCQACYPEVYPDETVEAAKEASPQRIRGL